ncbi:MAG: Ig-like domain-containing protein [Planctomycetes bacterium]|nr:Ig-like domain-containing protein [Planctomycetota bacterium]
MSRLGLLGFLILAPVACCANGCLGLSQNPSYFPYLVPSGDNVPTHARPVGPGYYANFDPQAIELVVEPKNMTCQVGTQVVVLATVRDAAGTPRRNRRVEWIVGNGELVEVDESGVLPGRGSVDGNRAVSYTCGHEQRLSRGNSSKLDDIMLRPGQSWCVVSSPREGDTHIQVVVPAISNWDKRMQTAVVRWVDASWEFPPRAVVKSNISHELVTRIVSVTERKPIAKYRVRYRIQDGPPALFLASQAREVIVSTDLNGLARARMALLELGNGVNRVSVEIIRPPDPSTPGGAGVPIATGEAVVEWRMMSVELGQPLPSGGGQPLPPAPKLGTPLPAPPKLGTPVPLPKGALGPPPGP